MKNNAIEKSLLLLWVIIFSAAFRLSAQPTLIDTDPTGIFNAAVELFTNEKYQSAISRFTEYKQISKSYLLRLKSDYLIALSAKELNLPETEALFLSYMEKYPEQSRDQSVFFELGKFYFYKKNFENAQKWLSEISNPRELGIAASQEFYFMLGYCFFRDKKYDKSITAFSKIDENQNPYFALANYYKGCIYYMQDKTEEALKRFLKIEKDEKFIRIVPAYITHIYLLQKKYAQVVSYGEKVLQMAKVEKINEIKAYMAEAYFQLKDYEKSMTLFKALLESGYKFTESDYYNYGFTLFKNGQYRQAIEIFNNIVIKETELGQNVAFLMGTAYLLTEDKYKARNMFSFAAKFDFDKNVKEISALNYAKLSYELGFDKEAISSLKKFISDFPGSQYQDDAQSLLSQLLVNTSNYKDAIELIEGLKTKNATLINTYQKLTYFYALEFFQNKKYNNAKEFFLKSIQTNVDRKYTALAYFWLGESYYLMGETDNAQREYKNFLWVTEAKKTPYYNIGYYNLAYTFFKQENYTEAKANFTKFITLENENTGNNRVNDAILRLGDCYFALKDYNNALVYYNKVINTNVQDVDYALYQKAILLGLLDRNTEKTDVLRTLTTRYTSSPYMDDGLYEIANMHFMAGDFTLAQTKFNYLIQEFPKSPYYLTAKLKVGLSYYNMDKTEKALQIFREIITQYPYSAEAREAFRAAREIYIDMGQADEVFKLMPKQNLTSSFQDSTTYNSAFSFFKKGKYADALTNLEKYLQKFPNGYFSINAHYYLAISALYLNRRELALEHFEEVIVKSPNEFVEKSLKNAAEIHYNAMNYEKALQYFIQLEEIAFVRDNSLLALASQIRCHYKLGEYQQTIIKAEKMLSLSYASAEYKTEANFYIGKSQLELRNYDLALNSFKQVISKNTADLGAESKYLIAYIYFLKEDYDRSIDEILELKDKFANNDYFVAKGFILLADVLVKTGDFFQAKSTLQSIIDNYAGEDLKRIAEEKLLEIKKLEENLEKPQNENDDE